MTAPARVTIPAELAADVRETRKFRRYLDEARARLADVSDECLLWDGHLSPKGYAHTTWEGGHWAVHRLTYTLLVGDIPDGYEVDHLCFRPACLNPVHLEAVTPAENHRRRRPSNMPWCVQGHAFDEVNTLIDNHGHRRCKACINGRRRAQLAALREHTPAPPRIGLPGEANHQAKLTEELVIDARRLFREGVGTPEIARRLGLDMGRRALLRAIRGERWAHVPGAVVEEVGA